MGGGPESSIGESTSFALRSTDTKTNEQTVTVIAGKNTPPLRFELKPIIRMAFLQIRRGAPESEVRVDDRQIGKVDSARIVRTGIPLRRTSSIESGFMYTLDGTADGYLPYKKEDVQVVSGKSQLKHVFENKKGGSTYRAENLSAPRSKKGTRSGTKIAIVWR